MQMSVSATRGSLLVLLLLLPACVGASVDDAPVLSEAPIEVESDHGVVWAEISSEAGEVVRGENTLLVQLSDPDGILRSATALMPAHGHGTEEPEIARSDAGYRVDRMLLYMPGRWDVTLEIELPGSGDRIQFSVEVP